MTSAPLRDRDYYHQHYGLTQPHTEIVAASEFVTPCKALDLGCGVGRNTLYLQSLGFDVTAIDHNPRSIETLQEIIAKEQLTNIRPSLADLNDFTIDAQYNFIFSTVVMMFLEAQTVPRLIQDMQAHTMSGGYNLIVSAMSTKAYPCTQGFSFTFDEGVLEEHYQGWKLLKYNEDLGELHRVDAAGNRIQLQFATLLAQKN